MLRRPFCLSALLLLAASAFSAELRVKVMDTKGKPVEDAVVSLLRADGIPPSTTPLPAIEITQNDQEFMPYVTVVTTGTAVKFPNKDTVQHHVYSLSRPKKFELPLYDPGKAETIVFDQPGIVTLGCNIHDWMLAYLVVLDTPYFAKTDAQGAATLTAPAGQYRFELWHPRLTGSIPRPLTLADGGTEPVNFSVHLKPDRRLRRAPDGKSTGYE
ncbi:MAG: methylamine utilization protein [Opitutae bacterium]|nr:methylamine utilization protein [Opitutae bacterium]